MKSDFLSNKIQTDSVSLIRANKLNDHSIISNSRLAVKNNYLELKGFKMCKNSSTSPKFTCPILRQKNWLFTTININRVGVKAVGDKPKGREWIIKREGDKPAFWT